MERKFVKLDLAVKFVTSKNEGLSKMVNHIVGFPEGSVEDENGIFLVVEYQNYGVCAFQFTDFEVNVTSGMHPGFDNIEYQSFLAKELVKQSKPLALEYASARVAYVDSLIDEEEARHEEKLDKLLKLKSKIGRDYLSGIGV